MAPLYHDRHQLESVVGKTIFDYADTLKVRVPTSCGRTGACHECIVDITRGIEALNAPTASESFLRDTYRLACQAVARLKSQVVRAPITAIMASSAHRPGRMVSHCHP